MEIMRKLKGPRRNRAHTSPQPVRRAVTCHNTYTQTHTQTHIHYIQTQWKHIARYQLYTRETLIIIIRVYSAAQYTSDGPYMLLVTAAKVKGTYMRVRNNSYCRVRNRRCGELKTDETNKKSVKVRYLRTWSFGTESPVSGFRVNSANAR